MFIRRGGDGRGPALEWRVRLLGAGAILGIAGMWAEQPWMVNLAIAVLIVGFLLRFAGGSGRSSDDPDAPE